MVDSTWAQTSLGNLKTTTGTQDNVVLGNSNIIKLDAHVAMRCVNIVKHRQWTDDFYSGRVHRHQNLRLLKMLRSLEISLHHANHDLTSRITCATGPVLLSIDDPLVTLEHRMRANIGRIRRSDIGLGHAKAGTNLAVHEWLKPLLLLSLSPVFVDDFHVARVGGTAVENLGANVRATPFLREVSVLDSIEASTVIIGQEEVPKPLGSRF